MLKWPLAFGIILLFAGVILVSSSRMPILRVTYNVVIKDNKVWELSNTFNNSDIMVVDFSPGVDWWRLFVKAPTMDYQEHVNFTIVGPSGYKTVFNVSIGTIPPRWGYTPESPEETPVIVRDIQLLSQDGDDLELREPPEIGGIVKQDGKYSVKLEPNVYWDSTHTTNTTCPKTPPEELRFNKEIRENIYPFTFLFPIGAPLSVFGVAMSIWGVKSEKHRKYRKLVKRKVKT